MALGPRHLMESCLENNNPEAHYIEGINQYLLHDNSGKALEHLRHSADGKYDKGTESLHPTVAREILKSAK